MTILNRVKSSHSTENKSQLKSSLLLGLQIVGILFCFPDVAFAMTGLHIEPHQPGVRSRLCRFGGRYGSRGPALAELHDLFSECASRPRLFL